MSESDLFHSSRDLQTNIDAAVQNFRYLLYYFQSHGNI